MNWNQSPWFLAETNHLLAACLIIIVAAWKLPRQLYLTAGLLLFFAGLKEFWADFTWLEHDAFMGSVADFIFYGVGTVGGLLANRWLWIGVLFVVLALLGLSAWDILGPLTEPQ